MDKLERLDKAMKLISLKRKEAVEVAAEHLETSERSVEKWLEKAQERPIPIIKLKYLEGIAEAISVKNTNGDS